MYFIYKLKNVLRNILTFVLIFCDIFLVYSVSQIITDKNNNGVIDVCKEEITQEVLTQNCLNYKNKEVIIGGDNIFFIPLAYGVLVCTVDDESIIKIDDYILEINDIKIETENHFIELIEESKDKDIKLKINRKGKILNETISYKEIVSIKLGIEKKHGNAVITFYDEETNKFASTGHRINFLYGEDAKVTTFAYDYVEKSTSNYIGGLCGAETENQIGKTNKNLETGVYGIIADESYVINNPKYKLGSKDEVQTDVAKIYCDIDGLGKQWYEVEIVSKEYNNSEKMFEARICDESLIEKTGGIISGMSGTPIVQNDKIIGAISKVNVNDPTVFYGIYIDYMVEDLYNTK